MSGPVLKVGDIVTRIFFIRGQKEMLDYDLASIYGVATRVLNQAVKRNQRRFPDDFLFQLTRDEWESLRSQFVILERTSKQEQELSGRGKYKEFLPYVFSEHGALMLALVLKLSRTEYDSLRTQIASLKRGLIFETIRQMIEKKSEPMEPVGFKIQGRFYV